MRAVVISLTTEGASAVPLAPPVNLLLLLPVPPPCPRPVPLVHLVVVNIAVDIWFEISVFVVDFVGFVCVL